MKLVSYNPKYKNEFIEMNKYWISSMFVMETEDEHELDNISHILRTEDKFFSLRMIITVLWLAV